MAKASKSQKTARRNLLLYKAALVIISTILIVWFMPRRKTSTFLYEVNKPWGYNLLISEFQFPIYKSDVEMKSARDSVEKSFQPYFNLDTHAREKMHVHIKTKTSGMWSGKNAEAYIEHISSLVDSVCTRGLMTTADYNRLLENDNTHIRIVDNNNAVSVPLTHVFSIKSAYNYIMNADTLKYSDRKSVV